jgi:prepilin-type N-terminal cleavage/methylation domain-containing protein
MTQSRGFTLIELLVVVAIIGILSAVVLVSLNAARNKGSDAAIISNLNTIRLQAELYYSDHNSAYGIDFALPGACPTAGLTMFAGDPKIKTAIAAADKAAGGRGGPIDKVFCASPGASSYVVQSALVAGVGGKMWWCVDSLGAAKPEAVAMIAGAPNCI